MHVNNVFLYRLPGQYFPHHQDPRPHLELPPARGWTSIWNHSAGLASRNVTACCSPPFENSRSGQNSEGRDGNAVEISECFSRLHIHFLAKYGERGAVTRAYMLFEAYGPVRNVDPKVLFSEDADGDAWSGAIDCLKS